MRTSQRSRVESGRARSSRDDISPSRPLARPDPFTAEAGFRAERREPSPNGILNARATANGENAPHRQQYVEIAVFFFCARFGFVWQPFTSSSSTPIFRLPETSATSGVTYQECGNRERQHVDEIERPVSKQRGAGPIAYARTRERDDCPLPDYWTLKIVRNSFSIALRSRA